MDRNKDIPRKKLVALFSLQSGLSTSMIEKMLDKFKYPDDVTGYFMEDICGNTSKDGIICTRMAGHVGDHYFYSKDEDEDESVYCWRSSEHVAIDLAINEAEKVSVNSK